MNQSKSKESSTRGGRRAGAGRKKGSATRRTREIADAAATNGITPLEFLLAVMTAPSDHEDAKVQVAREAMRFDAAKAAAPYVHPRLQAVEHSGPDGRELIPAGVLVVPGVLKDAKAWTHLVQGPKPG